MGSAEGLTIDQRLTLIRHVLNSVIFRTEDAGYVTVMDRLRELDVPIDELLGDTKPLSAPPYSGAEFDAMLAAMRRE